MKANWKIWVAVGVTVVVLGVAVGLGYTAIFNKPEAPPKKTIVARPKKKTKKVKPPAAVCPLDGRDAELHESRPLAIMVENLSTIRPQAGIGSACLVVEGLAEGGITRFMLVFGDHGVDNIGPVRSARTHFVALARGFDAIYGHVGGSTYGGALSAMKAIRDWGVNDWDQMGHAESYTRVGWTKAPHNVFTSTARLRNDASKFKDGGDLAAVGFKFKAAPPVEARPEGVKRVTIDFSFPDYRVVYEYDRQTNTYKRSNGGQPHLDANTKLQIAPANIAIMRAPTNDVPSGGGALDINVVGTGNLTFLQDGKVIEGVWEKPTPASPLTFKDVQGQTIQLTPGQTWIELVRPTTAVTFEQ